jgi:hypothetical protein
VVQGATGSIVGSGGEALKIETTSLAVLAWLRDHGYVAEVEAGIRYLAKVCEGGRYGSTQSTVLALRAIVAYDQARARDSKPGEVILRVDGVAVGKPVAFGGDALSVLDLPDLSSKLAPGSHQISLQMADGRQMPYSMAVRFHSLTPASALGCALDLQVQLSQSKLREGEPTEARVRLKNRLDQAIPTPVAILGVPGGLEPRHEQLKELVKAEKIAAYEVLGRDVVLYWRSLPARAQVEIPLSLVAEIPGRYTGPASRAYLYYTDELKTWVEGMEVSIEPR